MTTDESKPGALLPTTWGRFACDVVVAGNVIARFQYSDEAMRWGEDQYRGRYTLRPYSAPEPARAVDVPCDDWLVDGLVQAWEKAQDPNLEPALYQYAIIALRYLRSHLAPPQPAADVTEAMVEAAIAAYAAWFNHYDHRMQPAGMRAALRAALAAATGTGEKA